MAAERLSRLQRRILTWLVTEDQRLRGTMAASHEDLGRTLMALLFDKGNVSTSLKGLEAKGLVADRPDARRQGLGRGPDRRVATPGGRADGQL
jgi:DNA-binding MarR family transcriptional regulator